MEELGDPREFETETLRCKKKDNFPLSLQQSRSPSGNLVAVSSKYGYFFVASGSEITVHKLDSISKTESDNDQNVPPSRVSCTDLSKCNIDSIVALYLLNSDDIVLIHSSLGGIFLFPTAYIARGQIPSSAAQLTTAKVISTGSSLIACLQSDTVHLYQTPSLKILSSINAKNALSVAVSPCDGIAAVGMSDGNVLLISSTNKTNRTTIEEVEAGWIPFSLCFLDRSSLMVSYARDEEMSHVIWHISDKDPGQIKVEKHSPLGEICWSTRDNDEDQDGETKHPIILCSRIPEWNTCFITSSWSTDIECVRKEEDGLWTIWKFEEHFTPVLPTVGDSDDSFPVANGIDFSDTRRIDAADPSIPKINPMPKLLILTTENLIVPFSIVDLTPKAECKQVQNPIPLPDTSTVSNLIVIPDSTKLDTDKTTPVVSVEAEHRFEMKDWKNELGSNLSVVQDEKNQLTKNDVIPKPAKERMTMFNFNTMSDAINQKGDDVGNASNSFEFQATKSKKTDMWTSGNLFNLKSRPMKKAMLSADHPNVQKNVPVSNFESSNSHGSSIFNNSKRFDSTSGSKFPASNQFQSPFGNVAESGTMFSGTGKVNSTFPNSSQLNRVPKSKQRNVEDKRKWRIEEESNESSESDYGDDDNRSIAGTSTNAISQHRKTEKRMAPVTLETKLDEALSAVGSGDGDALIQSILSEMSSEVYVTKEASNITIENLSRNDKLMMEDINSTREKLNEIFQKVRSRYRTENSCRKRASKQLSEVLSFFRDYEATSLEFRVQQAEGVSMGLKKEDKIFDDEIRRREGDIVNMISTIEDGLEAVDRSKKQTHHPTETIQQIYSSLSLQGIRIKRVLKALESLSERVEQQGLGDRSADLGLSLARLEKLTLGGQKNVMDSPSEDTSGTEKATHDLAQKTNRSKDIEGSNLSGDSPLIAPDVRSTLRMLAMRNGREAIRVSKPNDYESTEGELSRTTDTAEQSSQLSMPLPLQNRSSAFSKPLLRQEPFQPENAIIESTVTPAAGNLFKSGNQASIEAKVSNTATASSQLPLFAATKKPNTTGKDPFFNTSFSTQGKEKIVPEVTKSSTAQLGTTSTSMFSKVTEQKSASPVIPPPPAPFDLKSTLPFGGLQMSMSTQGERGSTFLAGSSVSRVKKTNLDSYAESSQVKSSAEQKESQPLQSVSVPPSNKLLSMGTKFPSQEADQVKQVTTSVKEKTNVPKGEEDVIETLDVSDKKSIDNTAASLFAGTGGATNKSAFGASFSLLDTTKGLQTNLFAALPVEKNEDISSEKRTTTPGEKQTTLDSEPVEARESNAKSIKIQEQDPARKLSFGGENPSKPPVFGANVARPASSETEAKKPFALNFGDSTSGKFGAAFPSISSVTTTRIETSSQPVQESKPASTFPIDTRNKGDGSSTDSDEDNAQSMMDSMEPVNDFGNSSANINPFAPTENRQSVGSSPFGNSSSSLFGSSSAMMTSNSFGMQSSSQPFGQSTLQTPSSGFGAAPQSMTSAPFGKPSNGSDFGRPSASFGNSSPLGAMGGGNASSTFGNMPNPTFGQSSFGQKQSFGAQTPSGTFQNTSGGPSPFSNFANASNPGSGSPFAAFGTATNNTPSGFGNSGGMPFGGAGSGGSGFASLPSSSGAFGNGTANLMFGSKTGPPDFKAASAFSQRRK